MFTPSSCYSAQESAQRSALKDSDRRSALKDSDQQSALKDFDQRSALRESLPTPHYTQDTAHYDRPSACQLSSAEDTDQQSTKESGQATCSYTGLWTQHRPSGLSRILHSVNRNFRNYLNSVQ